jgi:putative FmdB family regulatory protein
MEFRQMPTYSYTCKECVHTLDAFQKISDPHLTSCPECGQESLQRGLGGGMATFKFEGSGFYITDYKQSSTSTESAGAPAPATKTEVNA